MSPLIQLSKTPAGKLEIRQLQGTDSVQVCVEFNKRSFVDAYFEDRKTQQRFYVLDLGDAVSVHLGLYNGEAWYSWVWMWESKEEADEAWSKVPVGRAEMVEQLAQRITDFIRATKRNTKSQDSKIVLDIDSDLRSIGWEMTVLEYTNADIAREYNDFVLSKKAQKPANSNQEARTWGRFWKK